jgi:adenylate kinase family enzyme
LKKNPAIMNYRFVLPIVGPAGCGKDTSCSYLEGLGANVLVTSAVLEAYRIKNPAAGKTIHEFKNVRQQNVPDEIVAEAMTSTLKRRFGQTHQGLWILNAYGRGGKQFRLLADWIENRNVHYESRGLPLIKRGAVFYTLTEEETMKRVAKRVELALQKGETPRPEDLGDTPKRRFDEYAPIEEQLIADARSCMTWVNIIDLGEYSTLEAAAMVYGMTHEADPKVVAAHLRQRFQEVA